MPLVPPVIRAHVCLVRIISTSSTCSHLFADTECPKDTVEQVVGVDRADDFSQFRRVPRAIRRQPARRRRWHARVRPLAAATARGQAHAFAATVGRGRDNADRAAARIVASSSRPNRCAQFVEAFAGATAGDNDGNLSDASIGKRSTLRQRDPPSSDDEHVARRSLVESATSFVSSRRIHATSANRRPFASLRRQAIERRHRSMRRRRSASPIVDACRVDQFAAHAVQRNCGGQIIARRAALRRDERRRMPTSSCASRSTESLHQRIEQAALADIRRADERDLRQRRSPRAATPFAAPLRQAIRSPHCKSLDNSCWRDELDIFLDKIEPRFQLGQQLQQVSSRSRWSGRASPPAS